MTGADVSILVGCAAAVRSTYPLAVLERSAPEATVFMTWRPG